MDTFEKIRALLAEQLDIDPAKITMESDIMSDFEADSLDIVDMVMTLEDDMLTLRTEPRRLLPTVGHSRGTGFAGHELFEASSIRKDGDKYIFVYSSRHNHELCYAVSDRPDGGFVFGGTLVSQGDLFLDGNEDEAKALNYLGNTHGGLLNIREQWYIFYHRQTNRHSYSRQACAEKLERTPDGGFRQAECWS